MRSLKTTVCAFMLCTCAATAAVGDSAFTQKLASIAAAGSGSDEAFRTAEPQLVDMANSASSDEERGAALAALVRIFRPHTPADWARMKSYAERALASNLGNRDLFSTERAYIGILERESATPRSPEVRRRLIQHYAIALNVVLSHPAGSDRAPVPTPTINSSINPGDPGYDAYEHRAAEVRQIQARAHEHNGMLGSLPYLYEGLARLYSPRERNALIADLAAQSLSPAVQAIIVSAVFRN